jgi:hypothetical protein
MILNNVTGVVTKDVRHSCLYRKIISLNTDFVGFGKIGRTESRNEQCHIGRHYRFSFRNRIAYLFYIVYLYFTRGESQFIQYMIVLDFVGCNDKQFANTYNTFPHHRKTETPTGIRYQFEYNKSNPLCRCNKNLPSTGLGPSRLFKDRIKVAK